MALLLYTTNTLITPPPRPLSPSSPSSSSSSSIFAVSANPSARLDYKFISLNSKLLNGLHTGTPIMVKQRGAVIVKASAEVDGMSSDEPETPPETKEENAQVENLPLESKLQLKLEQKMRMKLAKKIRLRRKRLVRKRHLRKKGRWPPSKMKKNKNV